MKVVTAPVYPKNVMSDQYAIKVFMAGGITNCWDWQSEFISTIDIVVDNTIEYLQKEILREDVPMMFKIENKRRLDAYERIKYSDYVIFFTPRRENFNATDLTESSRQIRWEFEMIGISDIFSMYFVNTRESDQPICFYELGRNLPIFTQSGKDIIITCENGFRRYADVLQQTFMHCRTWDKVEKILTNEFPDLDSEYISTLNNIKMCHLHAVNVLSLIERRLLMK